MNICDSRPLRSPVSWSPTARTSQHVDQPPPNRLISYRSYLAARRSALVQGQEVVLRLAADQSAQPAIPHGQIGRASCRERVEISVGAGAVKKKRNNNITAEMRAHTHR